jgi:prepilin-type N-terminal cleavage/methylation domain-containing protein/prepilin-type processing-associated H-X9-DG protein
MRRTARPPSGFSLLELLIVIGIIALLTAILMPVVSSVRKMSRSTVCLSNLRQWGQSFQTYLSSNHGNSIPRMEYPSPIRWWEALAPYNSDVRGTLLCPEASERGDFSDPDFCPGSATKAWWIRRGNYVGSYGFNQWVYKQPTDFSNVGNGPKHIRFPAVRGDRVPLLADCCWAWQNPLSGDSVPRNLDYPEKGISTSLAVFCIDRHQMAINVVFLDGHADHEPLAELWKLKWSQNFVPMDVVVPRP